MRPRPAQDVVPQRERYYATRPNGWLEAYEAAFKDFRFTSGMRKISWVESCQSGSYTYMDGRQNLRQTVEERGFKLG
jgi:hypothetical protein